jgi:hypothetical protein
MLRKIRRAILLGQVCITLMRSEVPGKALKANLALMGTTNDASFLTPWCC